MKLSCNVIQDLIPLTKDGVASDESNIIVQEHIQCCDSCRYEYETLESLKLELPHVQDEKIIRLIKRSLFITWLIILFAGANVGVFMTNSMGVLYNLLIMPVIGGMGLIVLKKKWFIVPLAVFGLALVSQVVQGIAIEGFSRLDWNVLYHSQIFNVIYSILVLVGVMIVALLQYAFRKEEEIK